MQWYLHHRINSSLRTQLYEFRCFCKIVLLFVIQWGIFWIFLMYFIGHCFVCRPSDSTVSEDAGIEPWLFWLRARCLIGASNSIANGWLKLDFVREILVEARSLESLMERQNETRFLVVLSSIYLSTYLKNDAFRVVSEWLYHLHGQLQVALSFVYC